MSVSHLLPLDLKDVFFRSVFTEKELASALMGPKPYIYLAEHFAAKEALLKAMGIPSDYVCFREIEILNHKNGQPFVKLHGKTKEIATNFGANQIFISLSNDSDFVQAFVVLTND